MDYSSQSDENIIKLIKDGDNYAQDFILSKYKYIVKQKARTYFIIGADNEDLIQEGMIGLYKAVRDYDLKKETPFKSFADVCITRQIITANRNASRQKHLPLNSYVSFDSFETDDLHGKNPEDELILREDAQKLDAYLEKHLSVFERLVFKHYKEGKDYTEIADLTRKTKKQVDNALQRIKKKLYQIIGS